MKSTVPIAQPNKWRHFLIEERDRLDMKLRRRPRRRLRNQLQLCLN
jgi:hypothetical protein